MIIVAGPITFDPAEWAALEAAFDAVRQATLAEPGCIDYDIHLGRHAAGTALLFERWSTAEALQAHLAAPHIAAFGRALRQLSSVTMDHTIYEAEPTM